MSVAESGGPIPESRFEQWAEDRVTLYRGDCGDVLPHIRPHSVDSVVTSPPDPNKFFYASWGQDPGGVDYSDREVGREPTLHGYRQNMYEVFCFLFTVSKPGGQLILNPRDKFNGESVVLTKGRGRKSSQVAGHDRCNLVSGFADKEPLGIPEALKQAARAAGWLFRCEYIWDKGGSGDSKPGDRGRVVHEPIYQFIKPQVGHRRPNTARYWDPTHLPSTVIRIRAISSPDHPCPWPSELAHRLICATTPENGVVLDPFMGENNTGVAALAANRQFVGIELYPKIFDKAVRRVSSDLQLLLGGAS